MKESTSKKAEKEITKCLAIDCEMVGTGLYGYSSVLGRVSIVNSNEECVYDTFVKPSMTVTDYRTQYSGCTEELLKKAPSFETVQLEVYKIIKDHIIIGHDIKHDLKALLLTHSKRLIRDTAKFKPFIKLRGIRPSLKFLVQKLLKLDIQTGEHSSVEDAKCTMKLYKLVRDDWERSLRCKAQKKQIQKEIYETLQQKK